MIYQKEIQFEGGEVGYQIDLTIEKNVPFHGDGGYDFAFVICDAFGIPFEKYDDVKSLGAFAEAFEDFLDDVRKVSEDVEIDTMLDAIEI